MAEGTEGTETLTNGGTERKEDERRRKDPMGPKAA
jgi:hypothetical protein